MRIEPGTQTVAVGGLPGPPAGGGAGVVVIVQPSFVASRCASAPAAAASAASAAKFSRRRSESTRNRCFERETHRVSAVFAAVSSARSAVRPVRFRSASRNDVRPSSRSAFRIAARALSTGAFGGSAVRVRRRFSRPRSDLFARPTTLPRLRMRSSAAPTTCTILAPTSEMTIPAGPAATASLEASRESSASMKSWICCFRGTFRRMRRPVSRRSSASALLRIFVWIFATTEFFIVLNPLPVSTSASPAAPSRPSA